MLDTQDIDLTLPSLVSSGRGAYKNKNRELVLTIVFHPDTSRIGQRAIVTRQKGTTPFVLGRYSPSFCRLGDQEAYALDDRHVSRRALQLIYEDKILTVRRFEGASRCRFGEKELTASVELDVDQLAEGIPLLLGHSIVLMLRMDTAPSAAACDADGGDVLRGSSASTARVREQITRAASGDMDVLILGETGTGKELVATAIHQSSRRSNSPLVSVNMAAIPTDLATAALFGSARGAYTGADKSNTGYFEQAEGGTLFLDEIGEASTQVQPQLLRALQQREIQAVGGEIKKVELRIISATDALLDDEAVDFKAALRYRLAACEIVMPPLREHPEDIGELLIYFLKNSAAATDRDHCLPCSDSPAIDIAIWAGFFFKLVCYRWPGNVREVANVSQQAVLACDIGDGLNDGLSDALQSILARHASHPSPKGALRRSKAEPDAQRRSLHDVDDEAFHAAMAANGFEIILVARQLQVSRAAVYRRIEATQHYRLVNAIDQSELQDVLASHDGDSVVAASELRVSHNSLRKRLQKLTVEWH
ncbi:MAG: DNA-binding NtrC family response regulator [Halioglobus sp.]|jgi:DNA-binding NtrC family response regulator